MSNLHRLVKINKPKARKLFALGIDIHLQSSNMPLNSMWQQPYWLSYQSYIDNEYPRVTAEKFFDNVVRDYCEYNCDNERGRYAHYYVDYKDLKR